MGIRLRGTSVSPELQRRHDERRCVWVLILFLAVMSCYAYLLTHAARQIGLPSPSDAASTMASWLDYEFDSDGNVDSHLYLQHCNFLVNDDERLVLFGIITGAFFCGYFLPLEAKRPSFVIWFLLGFCLLYGIPATVMLLLAHLAIYLVLHGPYQKHDVASLIFGGLLAWPMVDAYLTPPAAIVVGWYAIGCSVCSKYALFPLLRRDLPVVRWVRALVIHGPLVLIFSGALTEGLTGREWTFPLGLLFFLFQWARLITYYIDYKEGEVPKDLGLLDYLSVFLSPAVIPNFTYAAYIGHGYSYVSSKFLCKDKNEIILSGLRLWCIALFYLVFADWMVERIILVMANVFGIPVYEFISVMVREYVRGTPMSTPTVLLSTLLDQGRIFLIYGAVTHFRVGTWRVLGYSMDPQYNRPWLATNLLELWGRFAFHYREFLVRAVYYPVFFRCFKTRLTLRVFTAIMAATILGNPFWGHTPTKLLKAGVTWDHFFRLILRSWPYYVLLGLGISLTQLYLLRKPQQRKAWTRDRWLVVDLLSAYLTMQYFALIHIFIRPQVSSTLMDHVRLFLIGLGIQV